MVSGGSVTLKEEKKLRVLEKKILREIFGPKREEQTGEWRKLYNVQLHNLNGNADIIIMLKNTDEKRLTPAEMRFMGKTAGCSFLDHRRNFTS